MDHILKVSGQYLYLLWSYKDFRNNVVAMGVVAGGLVVGGVAVVDVGAYPEIFSSIYLFSVEL